MNRQIRVTEDIGALAGSLLHEALSRIATANGRVRLAVPGGTGPISVFQWLARHLPADITAKTQLTWVDERHNSDGMGADASDTDWTRWPVESNRRLSWEHWLSHVAVRPTECILDAPGSLEEARTVTEARFLHQMGGVDVVLLGVGPDGHIASLFPGHRALDTQGFVLAVPDSPKPPPERLTLSRMVIEAASHVLLVASGAEKGAVLAAALHDRSLPIGRLSPAGRVDWIIDRAAASAMGR